MRILVTGGAGFIGSNVVDRYVAEGHEVIVVDNLSSGVVENLNPKARFYLMDIRSAELRKVFELEKPDVVNHHAAQKSVPKSVEDPRYDADINVMGLLNVLTLCVEFAVKKVVFISSGGALAGDAGVIPTDESYVPTMISPYAITKYVSEQYLHFFAVTHNLKYTVLRYANVYGPRQIAEGECGVTPLFMQNILDGVPSRLYAYEDMPEGCTRDYVFVEDVAEANVQALTKGDNIVFNIGSGQEISTADMYRRIAAAVGKDIPLLRGGERVGDVRRSALDIKKAQKILGWAPKVPLDEGLGKTRQFYAENRSKGAL